MNRCSGRHCLYSALVCSTQIRCEDGAGAPRARRVARQAERLLRLLRRGAYLDGEVVGQAPVALVDLGTHHRVLAELLGDSLGAHGRLVVHAARPDHAAEQGAALSVAEGGGLHGVLLLLAGDERLASGVACARAADLHLGAVDLQVDALGVGVGEQVLQGVDAQAGPLGDGESAGGEQGASATDGSRDGGKRSTSYNSASTACGIASRRCTSVTSTRSMNSSFGLAPGLLDAQSRSVQGVRPEYGRKTPPAVR